MLEYPGAWQSKAFENSDLHPTVKDHLFAALESSPSSRLLLVRKPGQRPSRKVSFFMAKLSGASQALVRWELDGYSDLLSLDLAGIAAGAAVEGASQETNPHILVCTHGRRDVCCSRAGIPVFTWLREKSPAVWECSHVGGHRFAANVLVFPQGLLYGRVKQDNVAKLWDFVCSGQIYLPNLRGRLAYSPPAQAAEYYLRQHTQETSQEAFDLLNVEQSSTQVWKARFRDVRTLSIYELEIEAQQGAAVYESCALDKMTQVKTFRQIRLEEASAGEML